MFRDCHTLCLMDYWLLVDQHAFNVMRYCRNPGGDECQQDARSLAPGYKGRWVCLQRCSFNFLGHMESS